MTESINKIKVRETLVKANHRGRGRTDAEKKRDYAEYRERKKKVYEFEKKDTNHLMLFLASDGKRPDQKKKFYIMGGKSAVVYVFEIAPRIGRKSAELKPDTDIDSECKFKHVAVIANLPVLTDKLKEIGIKRVPVKGIKDDSIVSFELLQKYEPNDIKQMLKTYNAEIVELNNILYPKVLYPDIHKQILMLKTTVYHKTKNLPHEHREILQDKILNPVFLLVDTYAMMTHDCMDEVEAANEILKQASIMRERVSLMQELQLWEVSTCAKIGKILAEINILTKGKIINKHKKDEIKNA